MIKVYLCLPVYIYNCSVSTKENTETNHQNENTRSKVSKPVNNVKNIPELTAEDLLNLQVKEEKLLARRDEPRSPHSRSPRQHVQAVKNSSLPTPEVQNFSVDTPASSHTTNAHKSDKRPTKDINSVEQSKGNPPLTAQKVELGVTKSENRQELPSSVHHKSTHSDPSPYQKEVDMNVPTVNSISHQTKDKRTDVVYPWRMKKSLGPPYNQLAKLPLLPNTKMSHTRGRSDPVSDPVKALPKHMYRYADYIDSGALSDSEMGMSTVYRKKKRDDQLKPSLTFVGRRIESPSNGSPVSGVQSSKVTFSQLMKQEMRMSPITERGSPLLFVSAPPSGLIKVPAAQVSQADVSMPATPQLILSAPSPGPDNSKNSNTNKLPQVTVSAPSAPKPEVVSNSLSPQSDGSGDHSPRPEDIYFSAAAPDLVDIPMPQVKEMVADLNRRLEAIAAQQPEIAEPPTAQELGLSFEASKDGQNVLSLNKVKRDDSEKEIIINSKPMPDSTLESLKQRLFGTDITTSATFQKIYDVTSPITSPPVRRKMFSISERSPSPRSQRRVHFADPPAQSVIEIEPREPKLREKRKENEKVTSLPIRPSQLSLPFELTGTSSSNKPSTNTDSLAQVDSQTREEIYAKYSRLKSDIARETLLSPNKNPPLYTDRPTDKLPPGYLSPNRPPGHVNVAITHRHAGQASPTQYSFTLPQGQPGQPSHFRYTLSARKPVEPPVSIEYSFPPSYEESMRLRAQSQHKSLDDSIMSNYYASKSRDMQYLQTPTNQMTSLSPPLSPRLRSRLYVDTASSQGGGLSPTQQMLQRLSPQQQAAAAAVGLLPPSTASSHMMYPQHAAPQRETVMYNPVVDLSQSKTFRNLETHLSDGGKERIPIRVEQFEAPQQG